MIEKLVVTSRAGIASKFETTGPLAVQFGTSQQGCMQVSRAVWAPALSPLTFPPTTIGLELDTWKLGNYTTKSAVARLWPLVYI